MKVTVTALVLGEFFMCTDGIFFWYVHYFNIFFGNITFFYRDQLIIFVGDVANS
jgi:hypothetical protein